MHMSIIMDIFVEQGRDIDLWFIVLSLRVEKGFVNSFVTLTGKAARKAE